VVGQLSSDEFFNKNYGANLQEHLLEQYKLYVDTALDTSSKRLESNKFYLTLSSVIFGIAGYLMVLNQNFVIILFSIIGIIISLVWMQTIISYRELNSAKFHIIYELEQLLPARLFKFEKLHYSGKRKGFASIEKWCPLLFVALYASIILLTIYLLVTDTQLPIHAL
jgi:hypothetical protein